MAIGITDVKDVVRLPGTWDLTYLKKWSLADGASFDQVVSVLGTALVLFNASLTSGYWSNYIQVTTQIEWKYDVGGESNELEKTSEYTRPDPLMADFTGHMIPMHDYGGALGWTYMALRRSNLEDLTRNIRALLDRGRNTWQKRVLERLFVSVAETVGTSGKSVPFADGGTADSAYIPRSFDGRTFLNTHNHFDRKTADAAGRTAALKAGMFHLKEHGINPPYDIVIPEVDRATWAGATEFKKPERGVLSTAGVEVRAAIPEEMYIGLVEVEDGWGVLKTEPRLPTNYIGIFKPGGFNSPLSPLMIRYEEGYPLGLSLVGTIEQFPLQDAIAYFTFGAGIANRIAGYACYFAGAGNYVDPTIT